MKTPFRFRPSRRLFLGSNAVLSFALLAAALLVGGSVLQQVRGARADLTEGDVHTLSPGSEALARRLDAPATVTLYFSPDLPAPLEAMHRDLRDLLDEYRRASNGKLVVVEADPDKNPEAQQAVGRLGIQKVPIQSTTANKTSLETRYLGLGLSYREHTDLAMPLVTELAGFEYDFSSLLKRALSPKDAPPRTVRFLAGHGEVSADAARTFRRVLQEAQRLVVEDLTLTDEGVPADTSLLVVAAPTEELSEADRKAVDRYLLGGGRLLVLADGSRVSNSLQATASGGPVATLLAPYGITVRSEIVGDLRSMGELRFSNGVFVVGEAYPYFPRILQDGMHGGVSITRSLDAVTLRWPARVEAKAPAGAVAETLLSTSDAGVARPVGGDVPLNLLPQSFGGTFPSEGEGRLPLAVALRGKLPSAFETDASATDARLVVIGDADVATNEAIAADAGNVGLLLNSVDWLLQDEDLIEIRSKQLRTRALAPLTPARQRNWTWVNILLPPLLVALAGIVAWRLRRRDA